MGCTNFTLTPDVSSDKQNWLQKWIGYAIQ